MSTTSPTVGRVFLLYKQLKITSICTAVFVYLLQTCSSNFHLLPLVIAAAMSEHLVAVKYLVKSFCIGPVLRWFRSYLVGRSQHARHGSTTSTAVHLICNGTVPGYLQSCFTRLADMTSRQRLRSSASHRLAVPPVRLSTVGSRAFPVYGASTQRPSIARH